VGDKLSAVSFQRSATIYRIQATLPLTTKTARRPSC